MRFIILGLVIYAFWDPFIGSLLFLIVAFILEGWIFFAKKSYKRTSLKNENSFTEDEKRVYERFSVFFNAPIISKMLSASFSVIQLAPYILVPWLLFKGLYVHGILVGLNYLIATNYAVELNPQLFLHDAVEKRKQMNFVDDMLAVDSLLKKLYIKKSNHLFK